MNIADLFAIFLNVLAPVFILVALGWFAARKLGLEQRTLSRLSYYIFTPAFVFSTLAAAKIEADLALRMIGFITLVYLGSIGLAFVAARVMRRGAKMTAAFVMMAAFGNVGNFGLPIATFAGGQQALVPAAIYFLANTVLALVVCVSVASAANAAVSGQGKINWADVAWRVLKTPGLLAIFPALIINALGIKLPLFASRPLDLLSGAMIPIMLLTLGSQIAHEGITRPDRDMLVAIGIRLFSGPLIAVALAGVFGLAGIERSSGILQSSMPTAVLVSIIALEMDILPGFITPAVLLSHLASVFTLAGVLAFLAK